MNYAARRLRDAAEFRVMNPLITVPPVACEECGRDSCEGTHVVRQHCKLGPTACSSCDGAVPKKVEVIDGQVHVDGIPERPAQPETFGAHRNYPDGAARRKARRR